MKLEALKSFSPKGAKMILQGKTFTASERDAKEYIRLDLAKEIGAEKATDPTTEPTGEPVHYTTEELQEKKVSELREIAKNIGVNGYSSMTKSEVIFAILANQK